MLASARDRLIYARVQRDTNIWRLPLRGAAASPPAAVPAGAAAAAGKPALLIASTLDDHNPDFSPDGTRIAFASTRSGSEEIWVANADGSAPTQMTSMGGPNTSNARWSPDGRTILFNSRRTGSSDLYLLDVATHAMRRLTDDAADEFEARWSRDGKWIYFVSRRSGRAEVWKMAAPGDAPGGGAAAGGAAGGGTVGGGAGAAVQVTRQGGGAAFESADGRAIASRDRAASLEFFDFATRKTLVLHALDRPAWFGFALAPDERSVLFSQIDSRSSDLMLLENLR
jgi:dipeptidyl aminopeptidase/acylaminoacyl peptidase